MCDLYYGSDKWLSKYGKDVSLPECAEKCNKQNGCVFFIFQSGKSRGICKMSFMTDACCSKGRKMKGWRLDRMWDTYQLKGKSYVYRFVLEFFKNII